MGKHEATEPRPEPVLDAGRLAGLLSSAVTAILGAGLTIRVAVVSGDIASLGTALNAAFTAVMALLAYLAPTRYARAARSQVTPLEDPRDDAARPLIPAPRPRQR